MTSILEAEASGSKLDPYLATIADMPLTPIVWFAFPLVFPRTLAAWKKGPRWLGGNIQLNENAPHKVQVEELHTAHAVLMRFYEAHEDGRVRAHVCNPLHFVRTFIQVRARAFTNKGGGSSMVPGFDLFNHANAPNVKWVADKDAEAWHMYTTTAVPSGDSLNDCYGHRFRADSSYHAEILDQYGIIDDRLLESSEEDRALHAHYVAVMRIAAEEATHLHSAQPPAFDGWSSCAHCATQLTSAVEASAEAAREHCGSGHIAAGDGGSTAICYEVGMDCLPAHATSVLCGPKARVVKSKHKRSVDNQIRSGALLNATAAAKQHNFRLKSIVPKWTIRSFLLPVCKMQSMS